VSEQPMTIGDSLLFIMVSDLQGVSDRELRELLKVLARSPSGSGLQGRASEQLRTTVLDREEIEAFPDDYPELLPKSMAGYQAARNRFEGLLESLFRDDSVQENQKFDRFRTCLERLMSSSEPGEQAEASLGVTTLQKELFSARDQYTAKPLRLEDCTPASVVAHRNLLEGFDIWLAAFELAHRNEYEEALETALEGACIFFAVDRWAEIEFGHPSPDKPQ
jgi:hypothetical protein